MTAAVTTRRNGKAEMAYVGEKPWHGLGEELQAGASIEQWRVAAGMDWNVCRSRVRYGEGASQLTWDDQVVLFRSDNKQPLGVVSKDYKIVQPGEVLEFFRDLTADAGFSLETAGTLFDGKRYWGLAKVGTDAVGAKDAVGGYLLLSTSADGSSSTDVRFTTVRVVCQNTLNMALKAKARRRVAVTHRSRWDATKVKTELGLAGAEFANFMDASRALTKVRISDADAEQLLLGLLQKPQKVHVPEETTDQVMDRLLGRTPAQSAARRPAALDPILELFQGKGRGSDLATAQGTAWGLLNSVTEYVDHHARAQTDAHRLYRAWYSSGDDLKSATMERLLELA